MTEPISDEDVRLLIAEAEAERDAAEAALRVAAKGIDGLRSALLTAEAERDAAVAELKAEIEDANELVELFKMALSERDAALASSPEGVVTLPKLGQRVRITTDDGMDHVGEVIRYGDPEGNVRTLFMVALDDGSSGYFLDEPSWHWTLVPHRPEDTKALCPYGDPTCPCPDGDVCHYEPAPELSGSAAGPMRRPATVIRPGEGLDEHGRHVRLEATGDTEIVNLGGHGEQIGTWDPVESPLYRLVRPEDTKGGDNE